MICIFSSFRVQPRTRVPADVVSIAIAKRLSNSAKNGISERNLQYGSLKQPIEGTQQEVQKKSPINEELFYDNKRQVLELQPRIFSESSVSSEEESEEVLKPKKQKSFQPAELDFESIGYQNYQPSNPRYVAMKNSKPSRHETTKRPRNHHHHHKNDGSCGCYKDLVVDQSSISEQSMSYESPNEQNSYNVQFSS